MSPFDDYPGKAREWLGPRMSGSSRRNYGLWLMQNAKQTVCAYCGQSFVECFEHWLLITVDHVVPSVAGTALGIPKDWLEDYCNLALSCSGCNGYKNLYIIPDNENCPTTPEDFFNLRDRVFAWRKAGIADARSDEFNFFGRKPWEGKDLVGRKVVRRRKSSGTDSPAG